MQIIPGLQPLHSPGRGAGVAQGCPQEREVTRDTEDGQESSPTARWHPPSGGPVSRCPPAGSTALRSQEPHPCSGVGYVQSHRPGLKVDSRWGGWPGLFCSQGWYGRRGAHPVVWKSLRTEKAAEPPRCGSRWEMFSVPTQGTAENDRRGVSTVVSLRKPTRTGIMLSAAPGAYNTPTALNKHRKKE